MFVSALFLNEKQANEATRYLIELQEANLNLFQPLHKHVLFI